MNTKTKTTLIILGTLIIGIVLGVLGSGTWRQKKEHRIESMLAHQRFRNVMENIIQPTPEQRDAIDKILKKRSNQISAINAKHQNEVLTIVDSLRSDLAAVLTKEQQSHLEESLIKGAKQFIEMRVARLSEELQLDKYQQERIAKIMSEFRQQIRPEAINFRTSSDKQRQKLKNRYEKLQQELESVLTPEQREKYRKMRYDMYPPFEPPFRRRKPKRYFREKER